MLASSGAQQRLMGYETVHHGTPKHENVMSIKKHGIKKSHAGAGAAALGAKMLYDQAKKLKSKRIDGISNVAEEKHYV